MLLRRQKRTHIAGFAEQLYGRHTASCSRNILYQRHIRQKLKILLGVVIVKRVLDT